MTLRDARERRRTTKAIYPYHRFPPRLTDDATPRSLEPIIRVHLGLGTITRFSMKYLRPSKKTTDTDRNTNKVAQRCRTK